MKYSIQRPDGSWYYLTIPSTCRIAILPRPTTVNSRGTSYPSSPAYQIRVYEGAGTKKCLGQFFGTTIIAEGMGISVDSRHPANMAEKLVGTHTGAPLGFTVGADQGYFHLNWSR